VINSANLSAPDGGVITLELPGRWPWILLVVGAVAVLVGGVLLGGSSDDRPAPKPQTSAWSAS